MSLGAIVSVAIAVIMLPGYTTENTLILVIKRCLMIKLCLGHKRYATINSKTKLRIIIPDEVISIGSTDSL